MPLVNKPVQFDSTLQILINKIQTSATHSHSDWSSDDLAPLRRVVREHYRNTQRLKCAYCLGPISDKAVDGAPIEHIAPKSLHLQFIFEPRNLCVICPECNFIKLNQETLNQIDDPLKKIKTKRYPRSSKSFKIVHPHLDDYSEHIAKLGHLYIGLSKKGDWTIMACCLNRFSHRFGVSPEIFEDIALARAKMEFHRNNYRGRIANAFTKLTKMFLRTP